MHSKGVLHRNVKPANMMTHETQFALIGDELQ